MMQCFVAVTDAWAPWSWALLLR